MSASALLKRVPRHFSKAITFDGAAGNGAIGTVAIATVTGRVLLLHQSVECTTLLAGATATIQLGTANNTAALIALTTATDVDANEFWRDTTPELEVGVAVTDQLVNANIILTVATAGVSSGVLVFEWFWLPMSVDGNLA